MSRLILVLGESGQGKSRSIRNLNPKETVLINTVGKDVPFPGSAKMYVEGIKAGGNMFSPTFQTLHDAKTAYAKILKVLEYINEQRPDIKHVVLDDFQYLMSLEYFKMTGSGNKGWDRFEDTALHAIEIIEAARYLRRDLSVIFLAHTDEVGKGDKEKVVMKTIGKMLREKFTPEGMFTVVLITDPDRNLEGTAISSYRFRTQTNGADPAKSPEGMFPQHIPNDLSLVLNRIEEYYQEGTTIEESVVLQSLVQVNKKQVPDL